MARKTEFGRYILSAGEVGAFIVCPMAWKLRMVDKISAATAQSSIEGNRLHKEWANKCGEVETIKKVFLVIVSLLAWATIIYALLHK